MSVLSGKKIVLGISGGIAAYKTATLVRLFIKAGAHVQVIMTPASKDFITPLTLSTLSKRPVFSSFYKEEETLDSEVENPNQNLEWYNHVEIGLWADFMIIAPATANTMSKMANGICDNLLLATYLSAKSKVAFAPAMDLDMYQHPSVIANMNKLTQFGNVLIPAESGELASGLIGEGRMAEPENIVSFVIDYFRKTNSLNGKKAMVSAGPTYEKIDAVRFIGNYSTGKMGISIANELKNNGAEVTLILGPSNQNNIDSSINVIRVESAKEMYKACVIEAAKSEIIVMSAAVADYTPSRVSDEKIKKTANDLNLSLEKTPDILNKLGEVKKTKQILVGFALETNNEYDNAVDKLNKKNLDFIVLNSLNDKDAGFQFDTNKITIIDKKLKSQVFELKSKKEVAKDIVNKIISLTV